MRRSIKQHWIVAVAATLFFVWIVSFLLPDSVGNWVAQIETVSGLLGVALSLFLAAYNALERVYLAVNATRMFITNEPTRWDFSIILSDCSIQDINSAIWREIKRHSGTSAILWHQDDVGLIVNLPGYSIRVEVNSNTRSPEQVQHFEDKIIRVVPAVGDSQLATDFPKTVVIQLSNLSLPYREFRRRLQNDIVPLVNSIIKALGPKTERYEVKISFKSVNPYFGFFVRKLDLSRVVAFNCNMIEIGGHDTTPAVTVHKNRLDLVTDDLITMQNLSLKYIALSTGSNA